MRTTRSASTSTSIPHMASQRGHDPSTVRPIGRGCRTVRRQGTFTPEDSRRMESRGASFANGRPAVDLHGEGRRGAPTGASRRPIPRVMVRPHADRARDRDPHRPGSRRDRVGDLREGLLRRLQVASRPRHRRRPSRKRAHRGRATEGVRGRRHRRRGEHRQERGDRRPRLVRRSAGRNQGIHRQER